MNKLTTAIALSALLSSSAFAAQVSFTSNNIDYTIKGDKPLVRLCSAVIKDNPRSLMRQVRNLKSSAAVKLPIQDYGCNNMNLMSFATLLNSEKVMARLSKYKWEDVTVTELVESGRTRKQGEGRGRKTPDVKV